MNKGKIVAVLIVAAGAAAGVGIWYTNTYAYYEPVPEAEAKLRLTALGGEEVDELLTTDLAAISTTSSPMGYRACAQTSESLALLTESYEMAEDVAPTVAPGWFDCFDAQAIADELRAGSALAFLGEKNVAFGVDRIVAVTDDGRVYAWHELNNCGEKAYDGTIIGEDCPPRPGTE